MGLVTTKVISVSAHQWCPWKDGMIVFFSCQRHGIGMTEKVFKLYDALGLLVVMQGARVVLW